MIGLTGKTLHSERLSYRVIEDQDRAAFRALLADPDITAPAGFLPPKDDSAFEAFLQGLKQANCGIAILLEDTPIGYLRAYPERPDAGSEFAEKTCIGVGFVIGKPYHRKGYGTEMLTTLTAYLKGRCDFVFADAFTDNPASNRVIEKCGYRYVEDYTMYFDELGAEKTCHSYVF